jgi:hypothetical protein
VPNHLSFKKSVPLFCAVTFHCRLCRNTAGEASTARRGVRRPAVTVRRRGGNAGHFGNSGSPHFHEIAGSHFQATPLDVPEIQGNGHFQMSKAISLDITLAWAFGHRRPSLARSIERRLAACHNIYPS